MESIALARGIVQDFYNNGWKMFPLIFEVDAILICTKLEDSNGFNSDKCGLTQTMLRAVLKRSPFIMCPFRWVGEQIPSPHC